MLMWKIPSGIPRFSTRSGATLRLRGILRFRRPNLGTQAAYSKQSDQAIGARSGFK